MKNLKGWRTVAVNVGIAAATAALPVLAGVDWVALVGAKAAIVIVAFAADNGETFEASPQALNPRRGTLAREPSARLRSPWTPPPPQNYQSHTCGAPPCVMPRLVGAPHTFFACWPVCPMFVGILWANCENGGFV